MTRPRVSIAGLMAAVAVVAVNVAVWRSIYSGGSNSQAAFFYACGILPLASLLIVVGSFSVPGLLRGSPLSPFVFGFEAVGWVVLFAFLSWYSIAEHAVIGYASAIVAPIRPSVMSYLENAPEWGKLFVEFGFSTVLFSTPQLVLALLGGWLARRLGLTLRLERRHALPAMPALEEMRETAMPEMSVQNARPAAGALK